MDVDFDCPVDNCEECEFHRSTSWCSKTVPEYKGPDENYKIRMEGFWEGLNCAEEHYRMIERYCEKIDDYTLMVEELLEELYEVDRAPSAAEIRVLTKYWD